ncbi:hypothetical protein [Aromatoleum aromaticum]|uniref:hypothetical protein n=1 Tax=Aromatoleum aromaticum TaxID=551760 RepID=UPI0012FEF5D4|nr:hypothetical protein [Aromatoleum aromaticum]
MVMNMLCESFDSIRMGRAARYVASSTRPTAGPLIGVMEEIEMSEKYSKLVFLSDERQHVAPPAVEVERVGGDFAASSPAFQPASSQALWRMFRRWCRRPALQASRVRRVARQPARKDPAASD